MRHLNFLCLLLGLLLLPTACDRQQNSPTTSAVSPSPPALTPVVTQAPQSTPGQVTPIASTTNRTLIIWLPPEIGARTTSGAETFLNQLTELAGNLPDVEIRVEQKSVSGQGGILSYLRTGRNVAPDILPDLIVLPVDQLTAVLNDTLIYPLDGLLDEAALADLYPAARDMAQPDTQILGYPFALTNLSHLAYIPGALEEGPPTTWDELLALTEVSLLISGGGRSGAVLVLQLYLDGGGVLVNEAGQPALQVAPLARALGYFAAGRAAGLISNQSASAATVGETWQLFTNGASTMVQTTADQILLAGFPGQTPGFAPLSGQNGRLAPLVNGWAWALSTPEPAQQALAIEVLQSLIDDARLAEWSFQSSLLPARQPAFALWARNDSYTQFLGEELALARPFPSAANNTIMGILGNALVDVLNGSKSPQAAAEEAAATLQP